MAEHKISCPKCGGHIVFPKELAGQAIVCPHCSETFFLPKSKPVVPWVITAAFALIAICLGLLLVFQRHKGISEPGTHSFAKPNTSVEDSSKAQPDVKASKSADDQPQETIKYDLDVSYPDGFQNNIKLVQNVPLEVKVRPVSELVKLEVISTQFDLAKSEDFQDMLSARINYRVKNTSSEPIHHLDVKCVWYSMMSGLYLEIVLLKLTSLKRNQQGILV
jgi:DNA-directed RNA polymerase subunit RPC12/RpoP